MPHQSAAHKHQRGRLCVLAGGSGATSAARLSAEAGLAMGAGLVTLLCPPSSLIEATGAALAIMTRALREDTFAESLAHHRASACVLGPGAGLGEPLKDRVLQALGTAIPLVLDADALSVFADAPSRLMDALHANTVLTPHVCAIGKDDEAFDRLTLFGDGIDDGRERHIEEDVLGLGVVQHPGDLVGRKARIDRVNDSADAGYRVVELQVPVRVPGNGGDTVARFYFQRSCQDISQVLRARMPASAVIRAFIAAYRLLTSG